MKGALALALVCPESEAAFLDPAQPDVIATDMIAMRCASLFALLTTWCLIDPIGVQSIGLTYCSGKDSITAHSLETLAFSDSLEVSLSRPGVGKFKPEDGIKALLRPRDVTRATPNTLTIYHYTPQPWENFVSKAIPVRLC